MQQCTLLCFVIAKKGVQDFTPAIEMRPVMICPNSTVKIGKTILTSHDGHCYRPFEYRCVGQKYPYRSLFRMKIAL